jgi:hypothetical protein
VLRDKKCQVDGGGALIALRLWQRMTDVIKTVSRAAVVAAVMSCPLAQLILTSKLGLNLF